MKHLLPLLLSLLTALPALATDDELLDRIEQTRPSAFTTAVEHTKPGKKSFAAERGMIYYTAPGSFAMRFDNGNCLVFHANWFYNITERGTLNFSVEKGPFNKFMKTLLWTLAGRHRAVAEFQNGTLDVRDQGDRHSVSLTTRNRLTSGYKNITVCYRKSDLVPVELSVTDFLGRVDHYRISDYQPGVQGEPSVFEIPKKQ